MTKLFVEEKIVATLSNIDWRDDNFFYFEETSVNKRYTVSKIWEDNTIQT